MDVIDLKAKLLEQHKKDKKQILLKDALLFLLIIVFVVLAYSIFERWWLYLLVAGIVAVVIFLLYSYIDYKKIKDRDKYIERFIDKVKSGDKILTIREYRKDKIILPFSKTGFFPTDYISVTFQTNPLMSYIFPVNFSFLHNMEAILEQANKDYILSAKKDFLNADLSKETDEEHIPLKNVDEFKQFLYKGLKFTLYDVEGERRVSKPMLVVASIILFFVTAGWLYYLYMLFFDNGNDLLSSPYEMLIVIGVFLIVFYAIYNLYFRRDTEERLVFGERQQRNMAKATSDFKNKIMSQVVKFINPQAKYIINGYIDRDLIMKGGLFKNKDYKMSGDDLIIGKYNGQRFQFSDLLITHVSLFSKEEALPDVVFRGSYFIARLRKNLPAPVYLVYRKARSIHYGLSNISGAEIKLDDLEFMKLFEVYAPNTTYAEEVITPVFREGLKRIVKRVPGNYYISFCGDLLTIANNSGKDSFEIEYPSALIENNCEILIGFFKELYVDFILIDDLRLDEYA